MALLPDMVGIVVSDVPRSVRFYRLLGLELPEPKPGEDYVEAKTPNGYRISLNAASMAKTLHEDWVEPKGQRMELAFKCGSPKEVDETFAAIVKAGYRGAKAPWDAFWGQRYAIVEDPDGAHVSLFAPLQ